MIKILVGDVRDRLRELPADTFDCVVTSPPYWGLRDYGVAGQLGLEPTLSEHIAVMVDVFREVRRVMKPSGTLWLNYGDCFATAPNGRSAADTKAAGGDDRTYRDKPFSTVGGTLKSGDLCMIPNRLAIAMQDDGWWVKAENVWGKSNPMPDSSGAVRPATAHEKVFLLAKSDVSEYYRARDTGEIATTPDLTEMVPMITTGTLGKRWIKMPFYYNAAEMRVERAGDEDADGFRGGSYVGGKPGKRVATGNKRVKIDKQRGHGRRHDGFNDRWDGMKKEDQGANGRFLRNYEPAPLTVWTIATQAFSEAHFATFPPELAERCIKAGCPPGGHVLDPFGGAGTTGLVADRLGRDCTLIELNPEYAAMADRRIKGDFPMFTKTEMVKEDATAGEPSLFAVNP